MSQTPDTEPSVVSVTRAAALLGYSRGTIYLRLASGDLQRAEDVRGRTGVTLESIRDYLNDPPPGSWSRPPAIQPDVVAALRSENARLHEVVIRLRMAREKDAAARLAEAKANRHLRRALKFQSQATALSNEAGAQMDELLTQFLTPDSPAGAHQHPS